MTHLTAILNVNGDTVHVYYGNTMEKELSVTPITLSVGATPRTYRHETTALPRWFEQLWQLQQRAMRAIGFSVDTPPGNSSRHVIYWRAPYTSPRTPASVALEALNPRF